jgi:hypothetical protein
LIEHFEEPRKMAHVRIKECVFVDERTRLQPRAGVAHSIGEIHADAFSKHVSDRLLANVVATALAASLFAAFVDWTAGMRYGVEPVTR